MDKICLIRQPSGLGDIIFSLKIANYYKNLGYDIWWPVISEFTWISDYIDGYNFYNKGDSSYRTPLLSNDRFREIYNSTNPIFTDDFVYLPLQFADQIVPNCKIMESKYKMCNLNFDDWVEFFNIKRNFDRENELFYDILNLSDGQEYVLSSRNYGSPPNYLKWEINLPNKKIVELDFIKDYTLFDWYKVIENSSEIYTIDSSINYLIEKINTENKKMFLWSRRINNWSEINYVFKKNYNLMN